MTKQEVFRYLAEQEPLISAVGDAIWDTPELCFTEQQSAETLCRALEQEGFVVERNVAGIETAFTGTFGKGKPVIGFLAEFDALAGLSQVAGAVEKQALIPGANGHGCGHNLLGAGALAGAMGMKKYLETTGKEGTVVLFGCPAEEGGSGKAFMAGAGLFENVDCALSWHPGCANSVTNETSLANVQVYYHFKGISSHAAISPHKGRSALDAVELMNMGVQFLREHVIQEARIHYAITNAGGNSPNVVQPTADVLYLMRAPENSQVADILRRINLIAQGAAMMTETQVEIDFVKGCSNTVPNAVLGRLCWENLKLAPQPEYTPEDLALIEAIAATNKPDLGYNSYLINSVPEALLSSEEKDNMIREMKEKPYWNFVIPYTESRGCSPVSTDVGDVSWNVPTACINTACWPASTAAHSWQAVSVGKSGMAHKGTLYAGQVLAATAIDLLEQPALLEQAKAEFRRRLKGETYVCPIPAGTKPRIIAK